MCSVHYFEAEHFIGLRIDDGRLELDDVIGQGAEGSVMLARNVSIGIQSCAIYTEEKYAVKIISKVGLDAQALLLLQDEISLHQKASSLSHPNIIKLHNVVDTRSCLFLVTTYCACGDLFERIMNPTLLDRRICHDDFAIRSIALQLIDGIEYLHGLGIAHRDIKPENLYFTKEGRLFIGDFGLAIEAKWSHDMGSGTSFYASPEAVGYFRSETRKKATPHFLHMNDEGYIDEDKEIGMESDEEVDVRQENEERYRYNTFKSDIWSIGIVLINLIFERNPWQYAMPSDEAFSAYLDDPENFLLEILPTLSDECHILLKGILKISPRERLSLEEMRSMVEAVESFTIPGGINANSGRPVQLTAVPAGWIDEFKMGSDASHLVDDGCNKAGLERDQDKGITFQWRVLSDHFPALASAPLPLSLNSPGGKSVICQISLANSTQDYSFPKHLITPRIDIDGPLKKPIALHQQTTVIPKAPRTPLVAQLMTPTLITSPGPMTCSPLRQAQNAFLEKHYTQYGRRGSLPLCVEQMAEYHERQMSGR